MIFFYTSSRKSDKLTHPLTISAKNERLAFAMAVINFKKNYMLGTPKLINI